MIITPALIRYYKFEDSLADGSPSGVTATAYGSATYAAGVFGRQFDCGAGANCLDLGGSNTYINGPLTMCCHFTPATGIGTNDRIMGHENNGFGWFVCENGAGKIKATWYTGSYSTITAINAYSIGVRQHYAVIITDGSPPVGLTANYFYFLIDGVVQGSAARGTISTSGTHHYEAGGYWAVTTMPSGDRAYGKQDDIQVYNKAVTLEDVRRIMLGLHPFQK